MLQNPNQNATFRLPADQSPVSSPGLSSIRIQHGPADLLGRFFLMADFALRHLGVTLSFGTFDDVMDTNRENRDSWPSIVPTFDPKNGLCAPDRTYVLIGRNASGKIVTVQSTIVFDWTATNFKIEAESMRLFYAQPEMRQRTEETCHISAPSALLLTGTVAFLGAGWWHPSMRGRLLGSILARVSRAYAYTRWKTDLSMAFNSEKLIARGFPTRNGYQHIELGVSLRNFELGDYNGGIVWITADELFSELASFMVSLEARLNDLDRLGRAQDA